MRFLKKKDDPDTIYHVYTEGLAKRGDMVPFEPKVKTASVEIPEGDRAEKIKAAIATISVENYGKPAGGRPAMPRVGEVSELVKFKVSADEIIAAMEVK